MPSSHSEEEKDDKSRATREPTEEGEQSGIEVGWPTVLVLSDKIELKCSKRLPAFCKGGRIMLKATNTVWGEEDKLLFCDVVRVHYDIENVRQYVFLDLGQDTPEINLDTLRIRMHYD